MIAMNKIKVSKIVTQANLRDLLGSLVLRCTRDKLLSDDSFLSNDSIDSLLVDKILGITISIIDLVFFKLNENPPEPVKYSSNNNIKMRLY